MKAIEQVGHERVVSAVATFLALGCDRQLVNRDPKTFEVEPVEAWAGLRGHVERLGVPVEVVVIGDDIYLVKT